jgi:hypothetical protein
MLLTHAQKAARVPVLLVIMRLAARATAVARRPDGHPTDRYSGRYAGASKVCPLALGGCHHVARPTDELARALAEAEGQHDR